MGGTFGSLPHLSGAPANEFPAALPGKAKTPRIFRGAPAGSNSLAFPVSWVTMPEPLFPSTAPTQANPPLHLPENKNTPENPRCPCGEQLSGVPGELGHYARTSFPQHNPHASGFPAALPGKQKHPGKPGVFFLRSIPRLIQEGGVCGGNLWFPTTFERSASERIPRCSGRFAKQTGELF